VRDRLTRAAAASNPDEAGALKAQRRPISATRRDARFIDPFEPGQVRRLVAEFGSPLLIVDCARVRSQYRRLQRALPGVDLHYALSPAARGGGAGGARRGRRPGPCDQRRGAAGRPLGVEAARCIHTHPIKRPSDIRNALEFASTASSPTIPMKCASSAPTPAGSRCCCGYRSAARERYATCPQVWLRYRRCPASGEARAGLGIGLRGFSFHVGSQATDALKHVEAIEACASCWRARRERLGECDTLDIGGGFPIDYAERAATSGASARRCGGPSPSCPGACA